MTGIRSEAAMNRPGRAAFLWVLVTFIMPGGLARLPDAHAQSVSPRARVEALGLDTAEVGRVTVYFEPSYREHAERLAGLTEQTASHFEGVFGAAFPLHLAVLTPEDWFDPYSDDESATYGSPWGWVPDLLMAAPASLEEGVLIRSADPASNLRRVQFVTLHEFGHLAAKRYLHPEGPRPYSSVVWFEELLATYFAYAFIHDHFPEWAAASRREWTDVVRGYTPPVLSLDRGFTGPLPPDQAGRIFGWYQNLLNLRAATVYEEHGLGFLRRVRDKMVWDEAGDWTTGYVLSTVERFAPGFEIWAESLRDGEYLSRDQN
ncbi:MAG: hypothetical protein R3223_06390 [Longimicrobiales bacterium]|nr:hypothetical protein [Longimicrobiales bacterium]